MSRYNRFGKLYSDVMALYPGTVVADYDGGGANGQVQIEGALDRAVFEVAASISPAVYKAITLVDAQEIVNFAAAGQTSFTLGLAPAQLVDTINIVLRKRTKSVRPQVCGPAASRCDSPLLWSRTGRASISRSKLRTANMPAASRH